MGEYSFSVVLVVTASAMAISLLLTVDRDARATSLNYWALALLISPLGWLFYHYGVSAKVLVSAVLGKALVAMGMTLYLRALMLLRGAANAPSWWLYGVPAAIVGLSVLHLLAWPDRPLGSGVLSLICGGLALACAASSLRLDSSAGAITHGRVLALNFGLIALLSVLRALLMMSPATNPLTPYMVQTLSQEWLVALVILAPIVGTVNLALIERDQLTERFRQLAQVDCLTGAATRSHVLGELCQRFDSARRELHALAILILDVDHFKKFNDEHGHEVGDQILRQVSEAIREGIPATATLGRIGGEEFLVVLDATSMEDALDLAEQLRASVERRATEHLGEWLRATVSICCAVRKADDQDVSEMVRRADHAMYAAKRSGRNRVSQVYRPLSTTAAERAPAAAGTAASAASVNSP